MTKFPYERPIVGEILSGLAVRKPLMHILIGPRQVGKTTAALQIAEKWSGPVVYGAADTPLPPSPEWIGAQWERASFLPSNSLFLLPLTLHLRRFFCCC